ncbi:MAG: hypothetical protein ABEJ73_09020 [Haloplanus sp.]
MPSARRSTVASRICRRRTPALPPVADLGAELFQARRRIDRAFASTA